MGKLVSVLVSAMLLASSLTICTSAQSIGNNENDSIAIMSLYTNNVQANVERFYSNIEYSVRIQGKSSTTKLSVTLYLQENKSGNWKTVDRISKTINSGSGIVSDTYSNAVSGHKYRAKAIVVAYSGKQSESLTSYSDIITF